MRMNKKYFGNSRVLLAGMASSMAFAQQSKPVDDRTLRTAAPDEWVTYGRDYAETHFSPLEQIDTGNVSRLGLAWSWDTESPIGGRVEGTPLMSNGVLYGSLAWDVLFAVDARTGKMKWRWDPEVLANTSRKSVVVR
jgi:quinohemoprotein ethanol dehydrogenase